MNRRVSQPPLTTSLSLLLSFSISLSHHLSPSLSIALSFITHSPSPSPFNFPSLSFRFLLPRSTSEGSRSEPSFPVPPPPSHLPGGSQLSPCKVVAERRGKCLRKKGVCHTKKGGMSRAIFNSLLRWFSVQGGFRKKEECSLLHTLQHALQHALQHTLQHTLLLSSFFLKAPCTETSHETPHRSFIRSRE